MFATSYSVSSCSCVYYEHSNGGMGSGEDIAIAVYEFHGMINKSYQSMVKRSGVSLCKQSF
ncbi:hypothetical protein PN466_05260 [Roseofilum reptotaenium CS-1145]|uniref:hypothetical protein n=1 Tax=Roseofilum reptotaenium TaxID=1233427 RepID=UPI00232EA50F|nr:hypothetical protein [Roseofilum reptotaenium]MDB9516366.1 hypothetical protein [Roseofilum reptotaenium CS-1145]